MLKPTLSFPQKVLGPKKFGVHKNLRSKKMLGPKSLVKIGSVTAEIMLILTIVSRTYYVAWTNVIVTTV